MLLGLAALGALSRMGDVVPDPSDDSSSTIDIGNPSDYFPPTAVSAWDGSFPSGRIVVDFGFKGCYYCRKFSPVIDSLSADYRSRIFSVDINQDKGLEQKYGDGAYPMQIIFQDGVEVDRHHGPQDASTVMGWLDALSSPTARAAAPVSTPTYPAPATVTAPSSEWGSPPDSTGGWTPVVWDGGVPGGTSGPAWKKGNVFISAGGVSGSYGMTPAAAATPAVEDSMVTSPASSASRFPFPTSGGDAPAASGNVAATVNTAAGPGTWDYILQHGNPTWQAVVWNGQHAFKRKGKNQFSLTMSGLGAYSKHRRMRGLSLGALKTVSVPSYTTKSDGSIVRSGSGGSGGGISIESAGMILGGVAGLGIIGYVLYKTLK